MLPMERVRLAWRGKPFDNSEGKTLEMQDEWRSTADLPAVLTFKFFCAEKVRCDNLANLMKTEPRSFYDLHLEYVLNSPR